MTIDEIYRLVQTFANKEQRGFITPKDFNLLSKQAELELYNKRLSMVLEKIPQKKQAGIYAESLSPELAKFDISHFFYTTPESTEESGSPWAGSTVSLNADYIDSIFILPSEEHGITKNIPVEIVSRKDVNQILRSSLVKPSIEYPIVLVSKSNNEDKKVISVFPEYISEIAVNYYLYDNEPKWDYVTVAGKPVYNSVNSTQFRISSRVHGELVVKILEYLGVTIREADLVQYAQSSEIKADS
jgi:hypothetical protein